MIIVQLIQSADGDWIFALLAVVAFLFSLTIALVLHEVAHGYVALLNGDDTAKISGRLSLNPAKHFNLLGFAMLLLVGFGFANPVPVNPYNYRNKLKGDITVSLAGITTNLILAFVFVLAIGLMNLATITTLTGYYFWVFGYLFFSLSAQLNINFALFNILPLYPLDGYRLINAFVPDQNGFMTFLRKYSRFILLGLLVWSSISAISSYSPLSLYIRYGYNGIMSLFEKFWSLFGLSFS